MRGFKIVRVAAIVLAIAQLFSCATSAKFKEDTQTKSAEMLAIGKINLDYVKMSEVKNLGLVTKSVTVTMDVNDSGDIIIKADSGYTIFSDY